MRNEEFPSTRPPVNFEFSILNFEFQPNLPFWPRPQSLPPAGFRACPTAPTGTPDSRALKDPPTRVWTALDCRTLGSRQDQSSRVIGPKGPWRAQNDDPERRVGGQMEPVT